MKKILMTTLFTGTMFISNDICASNEFNFDPSDWTENNLIYNPNDICDNNGFYFDPSDWTENNLIYNPNEVCDNNEFNFDLSDWTENNLIYTNDHQIQPNSNKRTRDAIYNATDSKRQKLTTKDKSIQKLIQKEIQKEVTNFIETLSMINFNIDWREKHHLRAKVEKNTFFTCKEQNAISSLDYNSANIEQEKKNIIEAIKFRIKLQLQFKDWINRKYNLLTIQEKTKLSHKIYQNTFFTDKEQDKILSLDYNSANIEQEKQNIIKAILLRLISQSKNKLNITNFTNTISSLVTENSKQPLIDLINNTIGELLNTQIYNDINYGEFFASNDQKKDQNALNRLRFATKCALGDDPTIYYTEIKNDTNNFFVRLIPNHNNANTENIQLDIKLNVQNNFITSFDSVTAIFVKDTKKWVIDKLDVKRTIKSQTPISTLF